MLPQLAEQRSLPAPANAMDFSAASRIRRTLPFNHFSIKFVLDGCEMYTIHGQPHRVLAGQYLVANRFAEGFVEIDSPTLVKGICINLDSALISEAVGSFRRPDSPFSDVALDQFFASPDFFENTYAAYTTRAGQLLQSLAPQHGQGFFDQKLLENDLVFDLAQRIVADHVPIFQQLQTVPSVKFETKKELLRRLARGKSFLDEHFAEALDIATVARESCLSEFHFYRMFKLVHGQSPYQYALQKRLGRAAEMLRRGNLNLGEIAQATGFADAHAVSKAFKKWAGRSPQQFAAAEHSATILSTKNFVQKFEPTKNFVEPCR